MIDRSDAVNLARNFVDGTTQFMPTEKGVLCLAKAVLAMDAYILSLRPECHDAAEKEQGCFRAVKAENLLRRIGWVRVHDIGEAETIRSDGTMWKYVEPVCSAAKDQQ